MPVSHRPGRAAVLIALAALAAPAVTRADDGARFFAHAPATAKDKTAYQGSVISTTYAMQEFGGTATAIGKSTYGVNQVSTVQRVFSDVRTQLDAKHIGGGHWDARVDLRMRIAANDLPFASSTSTNPYSFSGTYQDGRFGGSEYEARELYVIHHGVHTDVSIGRQYSLKLAATKFDGVKIVNRLSPNWRLLGFGGLYPARGSRSIETDYPRAAPKPGAPADQLGARITPITAGAGAAYGYRSIYGAFGAVGIDPLAIDQRTGVQEAPRLFFSSNGYWRPSKRIDLYHYAVIDAAGAAGPSVTDLSVGANFKPAPNVHIEASYDHVDTETLDVIAQTRLDQPVGDLENPTKDDNPGYIQNNVTVSRISQDEARLSFSVALDHGRFEVTTIGRVRRRPNITLQTIGGGTVSLPAGKAAEFTLRAVDRHSLGGFRLGARATASAGIGTDVNREQSQIVSVDGYRHFAGGKGDLDLSVRYLSGADDNRGETCDLKNIQTCYGAATIAAFTVGGVLYYRFEPNWFFMLGFDGGVRHVATQYDQKGPVPQSPMTVSAGFARFAYRF